MLAKRFGFICSLILFHFGALAEHYAWNIDVDPDRVAAYETKMWQSYYERDFDELLKNSIMLLTEQFNLSAIDAFTIGASAAHAAKLFSKLPAKTTKDMYRQKVLPSLILSYQYLHEQVGGDWQPDIAASYELDWWMARRTKGERHFTKVGKKIAMLYAYLYGKKNHLIEEAGVLRAKAASIRDTQSRKGQIDWGRIETLLKASYRLLRKGVTQSAHP